MKVSGTNRMVYAVGGTVCRCALAGALLLVLSTLSACAGQDVAVPLPAPAGGGTRSVTGPTVTDRGHSPTGSVDRSEPLAVYQAWWAAVEKALATADANEPDLSRYGADPLLGATRIRLISLRVGELVQVVHYTHTQRVVSRTSKRVDIEDCVRGPAGTFRDARTHQPRAPSNFRNDIPTHDSIRSVLQAIDGTWYVTAIQAGSMPC
jgi:hypothetical protein